MAWSSHEKKVCVCVCVQKTQDCIAWRQEMEDAAQTINSEHETQEKEAKDEK